MRILIVRLSALGDLVLTEPFVRALKAQCSHAEIELVTDQRYVELMRSRGPFTRVYGWPTSNLMSFARNLGRYDLVFDLQTKLRTQCLLRLVLAEAKSTLVKRSLWASIRIGFRSPELQTKHAVQRYLSVLGSETRITAPQLSRFNSLHSGHGVGFFIDASQATKRWPLHRFAGLARRLAESGEPPLVLGDPSGDAVRKIERLVGRGCVRIYNEPIDRPERLADALESLEVLVSNDSGPAHLAAALGVRVIVLFGPTDPRQWGPLGGHHRVVRRNLSCMPCARHGRPVCPQRQGHHACLRGLSEDLVLEALRSVM